MYDLEFFWSVRFAGMSTTMMGATPTGLVSPNRTTSPTFHSAFGKWDNGSQFVPSADVSDPTITFRCRRKKKRARLMFPLPRNLFKLLSFSLFWPFVRDFHLLWDFCFRNNWVIQSCREMKRKRARNWLIAASAIICPCLMNFNIIRAVGRWLWREEEQKFVEHVALLPLIRFVLLLGLCNCAVNLSLRF